MATRSSIAYLNNDSNIINSVYCHWDGYPEYNGRILLDHYGENEIKELIQLGDLSYLGIDLSLSKFYCRDMGEGYCSPECHSDEETYLISLIGSGVDYAYLFKHDEWYVADMNASNVEFLLLTTILK